MSRKFYAVNRETGERWKPSEGSQYDKEYLVMYDSGYLAVVEEGFYSQGITPLCHKTWKIIHNTKDQNVIPD